MKKILGILSFMLLISCNTQSDYSPRDLSIINLKTFIIENCDIRAITALEQNVGFAGSNGIFGFIDTYRQTIKYKQKKYYNSIPNFRAVANTQKDFFMLSIDNPALLFAPKNNEMQLIYKEEAEGVFYDCMKFYNENNGIAVGDAVNGCMSIIQTTDGGNHWEKLGCENAPKLVKGEVLFAASNSNVAFTEKDIKIVTGGVQSQLYSMNKKEKNWTSTTLPLVQGKVSQGAFSVDFYDENNGFIVGGDYLKPNMSDKNMCITSDGGKTWRLIKKQNSLGYMSCVRYVREGKGNELIACGPSGIWFTNNQGENWKLLDKNAYHSVLILNKNTLVASGNEKITIFRIIEK